MWAKIVEKDLTQAEVLAEESLRAKWEANPITGICNTEVFLKYVLSVLKAEKQKGMGRINNAFAAMAAAEADIKNRAASTEKVGLEHREKVIEFLVQNNYELPSASYLEKRIATKPGELTKHESWGGCKLTQTTVTRAYWKQLTVTLHGVFCVTHDSNADCDRADEPDEGFAIGAGLPNYDMDAGVAN
mgnify:CR=1 FL=1